MQTPAAPGLGSAPEGQRRLNAILHVELAVLYFPFRQTTPVSQSKSDNQADAFSPGSVDQVLSAVPSSRSIRREFMLNAGNLPVWVLSNRTILTLSRPAAPDPTSLLLPDYFCTPLNIVSET